MKDDFVFEIDPGILRESSKKNQTTVDILVFNVNGRELGFENNGLLEILKPHKITPVPFTEDFVLGLINVRGEIISCIDIGHFLFSNSIEIDDKSRIILIGNKNISTSIMVSSVRGIEQIQESRMDKSPKRGKGLIYEFLKWIIDTDKKSIPVLDIDKILNSEKLRSYEKR